MLTLIIIVALALAAGAAGFFAGVKHAEKAREIKGLLKK